MKKLLVLFAIGAFVVIGGPAFLLLFSWTSETPSPTPPREARNVHFHERTAWQTWDYEYRFDAPPTVCEKFAIDLMKLQSTKGDGSQIVKSNFAQFPIKSRFEPWFDVASVKNGTLISADNWIYAVIDHDRGRLYYYNSH